MNKSDCFGSNGIRFTSFQASEELIYELRQDWESFVANSIPNYLNDFSGKGIVICAGGIRYFTCAWVNINLLRKKGCVLPIELWYNDGELNHEIILKLKKLNVECKNVDHFSSTSLKNYALKPFAILNSSFKEVLFIDADNNCLSDPTELFESEEYRQFGCLFWPDFWKTDIDNPIWKIINNNEYFEFEQESGQILINKERCWRELNLCMYFNSKRDIYYKFLLGDKDTFKFAWKALHTPYFMISTSVGYCGFSTGLDGMEFYGLAMVQHDLLGKPLFIHQNLLKWDLVKDDELLWAKIKTFQPNSSNRRFVFETEKLSKPKSIITFDIDGDVRIEQCSKEMLETEKICLQVLKDLRKSIFYLRFIIFLYQSRNRN